MKLFAERLLNRIFRKSCDNHVSEANNTNNTCQNCPITKNHTHNLQIDPYIIHRYEAKNQLQVSSSFRQNCEGFSLIEVLIVSSLLAAMAYFGMDLMETMKNNQKEIEGQFEIQSIHSEITKILSDSKSCIKTFEDSQISSEFSSKKEETQIVSHIKKVFQSVEDDRKTEIFTEKFKLYDEKLNNFYNSIRILDYKLLMDKEDYYQDSNPNTDLTLQITYGLKRSGKNIKEVKRTIPLSLELSDNYPRKIMSCDPSIGPGNSIEVLDPLADRLLFDKTGFEACESIGRTCKHVFSQNYATKVYGNFSLSSLCAINYNTSENLFKKGSPISPIHSCDLKLGVFNTYIINKKDYGVTCQGLFMAMCN